MGGQPSLDPEIRDQVYGECWWKWARNSWSYERIAQYLFKEYGVTNPRDPDKPVHRATIGKWIAKGEKAMTSDQAQKHRVELSAARVELDDLKERLYDLLDTHEVVSLDEVVKFTEAVLKVRTVRNSTHALFAKIQDIAESRGGSDIKLDPDTDAMLRQLEAHVAEGPQLYRLRLDVS